VKRRNRWPQAIVVAGLFLLTALFLVGHWGTAGTSGDPLQAVSNPTRLFEGVVVAGETPLAGVELELREGTTPVDRAVSGPDGRYAITWRPRTTTSPGKLRLLATHAGYAKTIAPPGERIDMGEPVTVEGLVVTPDGRPWPGVRVEVASLGEPYGTATSAADGTFALDGVARGAELDAFVEGGGVAPAVFRGFATSDRLVLHVERGKEVEVWVRDPSGLPVVGATTRFAAPEGFTAASHAGEHVRLVATPASSAFVVARAPGYLPVFLDAPAQGRVEAVLWPARTVSLRVWDAVRRRGVFDIELEVMLARDGANLHWNGPDAGRSFREFPLRMEDRRGAYTLTLPRAPVKLLIGAAGYSDRIVDLGASETEATIRMRPLREAPSATLAIRCEKRIALVVADEEQPWFAAFEAPGEVTVPAGRRLELASAGAADGVWLPPIVVEPIGAGRRREIRVPLRPAAELIVETQPPTPCEIELEDTKFGKAVPPERVQSDGRARLWVRPRREVKVTIRPKGNFRPIEGEFAVEPPKREWTAYLLEAAGLRATVRDVAGNPVPFARLAYWEAGLAGRADLRALPTRTTADAAGRIELLGLRNGPTPIEIEAEGFRTARPRVPELETGRVLDLGALVLQPAGLIRGVVVDPDGEPLAGVFLRTCARGLRRLELPGGGARDLYDLTDEQEGDAVTDEQGLFEVQDRAPRLPLLVADARGRRDLAFFAAPAEGAMTVTMPRAAHVALEVAGSVEGVYLLLEGTRALRVHSPGPLRLNPIPLTLPAGKVEIFVRYQSGRWAAGAFELHPGDQRIEMPAR